MQTVWQDLRYGARMSLKRPVLTLIVSLTIAIGIGGNTAIFSVVNAVLLRPLPYDEADRLVHLTGRSNNAETMSISYPDFNDWREQNHVFESIGVYNFGNYNLTTGGEPERLRVGQFSADLFTALRVRPALGRLFTNEDDKPGAPSVAVLSYELWQRRFGGDPNVLNQSLSLNDQQYTVVGVMRLGFRFTEKTEMWVPIGQLAAQQSWRERDNRPGLTAVARLKNGVTIEQARSELDAIAARLEQQYPQSNKNIRVRIIPLLENYVRDVRSALWILLGAVGLVLLIACANVANLLLGHAATRQREIAVRLALGATRWRVIRQMLTESLLLAVVGGALGLLLARWGVKLIVASSASSIPRVNEIGFDKRVLICMTVATVITGVIFGLAPALQSSRADLHDALKETGRSATGGRHRLRQGLVVAEVTLTLVLLVGAGLLIRSFYSLQQVDVGFVDEHAVSFSVLLPQQKYSEEQQRINFYLQVMQNLRMLPGVKDVGIASRVPMGGNFWLSGFRIVGQPPPPPGSGPLMEVTIISPEYFRVMGIPLLQGRYFTEQDNRSGLSEEKLRNLTPAQRRNAGLKSMIVDHEFARRYWPNEEAVGKQIRWGADPSDPLVTIVGVVGRVKLYSPNESGGFVQAYFPFLELPNRGMSFVVKTALDPELIISSAKQQVYAVDRNQPVYDVRSLSQLRDEAVAPQRLNLLLLEMFAAVALVLAIVGIYGVVNYAVMQRMREIGLRMALGAQTRNVLNLIVGQAMKLTLIGVALGLLGAIALTRFMRSLLFNVSATDPMTYVVVALLLVLVALLASWIPVRRAIRVDPMIVLRSE
jgi:putative ABC transport system permease protein